MSKKIERMNVLIKTLNMYSMFYYKNDTSLVTDKEYDDLYIELLDLEDETRITMAGSPSQRREGYLLDYLPVIKHAKPMLSVDKTKDVGIIKKFCEKGLAYASWKLDGCFAKNTKITMGDGSFKNIQDIQVGDIVKTYDEKTGNITTSKVSNVFYNGKKEASEWVKINTLRSKYQKSVIQATNNHMFMTPNGWKEIGKLSVGDEILTEKYCLSESQLSFIIGGAFGDGSINIRTNLNLEYYDSLQFSYCKVNNSPYVSYFEFYKELFKNILGSNRQYKSGYGSDMNSQYLKSLNNIPLALLKSDNIFNKSRFIINEETLKYMTPMALAIFYIDDGNKNSVQMDGYDVKNTTPRSTFSMYRYTEEEVACFSSFLKEKYNISNTYNKYKMNSGIFGYTLTISAKSIYDFYDIVVPYIPKEIRKVKISNVDKYQNMDEFEWWKDCGDYELCATKITDIENVKSKSWAKYYDAYDLEVENTHNYFVKDKLVHNCTLVLTYYKGCLMSAVTRGNGEFGEDVTEQAKFVNNIPLYIPYDKDLVVRGEAVISWNNFKSINDDLPEKIRYTHPRNLAAGTIRQLNTGIVRERNVEFFAFECVTDIGNEYKDADFRMLQEIGFSVVDRSMLPVDDVIPYFDPEICNYPVDGIMFEYLDRKFSKSLGATTKYENCRFALKWKDEVYETKLFDIEWNTSRTGLINPVAIFEAVDLDGANTTRASVHNVSIIKRLKLGIGDSITVYRANKVIPQIYENLTKSDTCEIPKTCPICGGKTIIRANDGVETLHCISDGCKAKLINKIDHFANRDGMDIDGLGDSTIERFVDLGIIRKIEDIYDKQLWKDNKRTITNLQGFGEVSYDNLMRAIEKSRNTTLTKFLTSLGIPFTGKGTCKKLSTYCGGDINKFIDLYYDFFCWGKIKDIGAMTECAITDYLNDNISLIKHLATELSFEVEEEEEVVSDKLAGKVFAITGELQRSRRADLVKLIQSLGGKVIKKVVLPKTGKLYLINNDVSSETTKNVEAKKLGVDIITEEIFYWMIANK